MTSGRVDSVSMLPRLHIPEDGQPERVVAIRATMTIGRDDDNDIVLAAMTVSRCHAVLLRDLAGVLLIDLESANGTLVNGEPVAPDEPLRLTDGDLLQLGFVAARYSDDKSLGTSSITPTHPSAAHGTRAVSSTTNWQQMSTSKA